MKNLRIVYLLFSSMIIMSCSSDDAKNELLESGALQATINGGTFSNYSFKLGVYQVAKGTNGNTLKFNLVDKNGKQITLFLNSTGGFTSGTSKQMGDVDSDGFKTYAEIKDNQPEAQYFSESGSLKITHNREHPSHSQKYLISGTFSIVASTIDGTSSTTTLKGSFNELEYLK